MSCYINVTNGLLLGETGELSIEKASGSVAKYLQKLLKNWK